MNDSTGAALFAKRKQKSEKWIVDENSFKQKTAAAAAAAAAAGAAQSAAAAAPAVAAPTPNLRVEQNQKIASVQVGISHHFNIIAIELFQLI